MKNQPAPGMSIDEFKPVPCSGCQSIRRRPVVFAVDMVHRFKASLVVQALKQVSVCVGCGAQVTDQGHPTPPDDPDFLTERELESLGIASRGGRASKAQGPGSSPGDSISGSDHPWESFK